MTMTMPGGFLFYGIAVAYISLLIFVVDLLQHKGDNNTKVEAPVVNSLLNQGDSASETTPPPSSNTSDTTKVAKLPSEHVKKKDGIAAADYDDDDDDYGQANNTKPAHLEARKGLPFTCIESATGDDSAGSFTIHHQKGKVNIHRKESSKTYSLSIEKNIVRGSTTKQQEDGRRKPPTTSKRMSPCPLSSFATNSMSHSAIGPDDVVSSSFTNSFVAPGDLLPSKVANDWKVDTGHRLRARAHGIGIQHHHDRLGDNESISIQVSPSLAPYDSAVDTDPNQFENAEEEEEDLRREEANSNEGRTIRYEETFPKEQANEDDVVVNHEDDDGSVIDIFTAAAVGSSLDHDNAVFPLSSSTSADRAMQKGEAEDENKRKAVTAETPGGKDFTEPKKCKLTDDDKAEGPEPNKRVRNEGVEVALDLAPDAHKTLSNEQKSFIEAAHAQSSRRGESESTASKTSPILLKSPTSVVQGLPPPGSSKQVTESILMQNIIEPIADVVPERGRIQHSGNIVFNLLVNENKEKYARSAKVDRRKISSSIVAKIRMMKGSFFELDSSGSWYDIGDERAIEHTLIALQGGHPISETEKLVGGESIKPQSTILPVVPARPTFSPLTSGGEKKKVHLPHQYPPVQTAQSVVNPYSALIAAARKSAPKPQKSRDGSNFGKEITPHAHDVLLGRGGLTNRHPGNEWFRRLVQSNRHLYKTVLKHTKIVVAKAIVEAVYRQNPAGRFLERTNHDVWKVASHKRAVDKTSQALREKEAGKSSAHADTAAGAGNSAGEGGRVASEISTPNGMLMNDNQQQLQVCNIVPPQLRRTMGCSGATATGAMGELSQEDVQDGTTSTSTPYSLPSTQELSRRGNNVLAKAAESSVGAAAAAGAGVASSSSPVPPLGVFEKGSVRVVSGSGFRHVVPFPWRLHQMLEDIEKLNEQTIVSWLPDGSHFQVHNPQLFMQKIIPKFFKQKSYKSFQRQLHLYGFQRVLDGPYRGAYYHESFIKEDRKLSLEITRIKANPQKSRDKEITAPRAHDVDKQRQDKKVLASSKPPPVSPPTPQSISDKSTLTVSVCNDIDVTMCKIRGDEVSRSMSSIAVTAELATTSEETSTNSGREQQQGDPMIGMAAMGGTANSFAAVSANNHVASLLDQQFAVVDQQLAPVGGNLVVADVGNKQGPPPTKNPDDIAGLPHKRTRSNTEATIVCNKRSRIDESNDYSPSRLEEPETTGKTKEAPNVHQPQIPKFFESTSVFLPSSDEIPFIPSIPRLKEVDCSSLKMQAAVSDYTANTISPVSLHPQEQPISDANLMEQCPEAGQDEKSTALVPLAEEGDFQAFLDEDTYGRVYYFNFQTGETLWEPPTDTFPPVIIPPEKERLVEELQKRSADNPMASLLDQQVVVVDQQLAPDGGNLVVAGAEEGNKQGEADERFRDYRSKQWHEKLQELIEFKKQKGHCCVPQTSQDNLMLSNWVKRQRHQYKLLQENKSSTMTVEHIKTLEGLGFIWDAQGAAWEEHLTDLKQYQSSTGHCNVPSRYSENKALALWVQRQRRQYIFFRDGKPSNITLERIAKLDKLGFSWAPRASRSNRTLLGPAEGKSTDFENEDEPDRACDNGDDLNSRIPDTFSAVTKCSPPSPSLEQRIQNAEIVAAQVATPNRPLPLLLTNPQTVNTSSDSNKCSTIDPSKKLLECMNRTSASRKMLQRGGIATNTKEKEKLSRSLVAALRGMNGRFLKRDGNCGTWYDIGDKRAIEMTSQALKEEKAASGGMNPFQLAMIQQTLAAQQQQGKPMMGMAMNPMTGNGTIAAMGGMEYEFAGARLILEQTDQTTNTLAPPPIGLDTTDSNVVINNGDDAPPAPASATATEENTAATTNPLASPGNSNDASSAPNNSAPPEASATTETFSATTASSALSPSLEQRIQNAENVAAGVATPNRAFQPHNPPIYPPDTHSFDEGRGIQQVSNAATATAEPRAAAPGAGNEQKEEIDASLSRGGVNTEGPEASNHHLPVDNFLYQPTKLLIDCNHGIGDQTENKTRQNLLSSHQIQLRSPTNQLRSPTIQLSFCPTVQDLKNADAAFGAMPEARKTKKQSEDMEEVEGEREDCGEDNRTDVTSEREGKPAEGFDVSSGKRGSEEAPDFALDTPHGIHFGRDTHGPLPPLTGPSLNSKEGRKKKEAQKKEGSAEEKQEEATPPPPIPQIEDRPLVFPEDKPLISDYIYLTFEQMIPSVLVEADRVGCYKTRKVGFPGLACKHCVGRAGRYFPESEASLSQTTTSQMIMNHVRYCLRCPIEIRENLEIMKRAHMGPESKHSRRKVFFHRLWCRIRGDGDGDGDDFNLPDTFSAAKASSLTLPSLQQRTPPPSLPSISDKSTTTIAVCNDVDGTGEIKGDEASRPMQSITVTTELTTTAEDKTTNSGRGQMTEIKRSNRSLPPPSHDASSSKIKPELANHNTIKHYDTGDEEVNEDGSSRGEGGVQKEQDSSSSFKTIGSNTFCKTKTVRERLLLLESWKDQISPKEYSKQKKQLRLLKELEGHLSVGNKGLPSHSKVGDEFMSNSSNNGAEQRQKRHQTSTDHYSPSTAVNNKGNSNNNRSEQRHKRRRTSAHRCSTKDSNMKSAVVSSSTTANEMPKGFSPFQSFLTFSTATTSTNKKAKVFSSVEFATSSGKTRHGSTTSSSSIAAGAASADVNVIVIDSDSDNDNEHL